MPWTCYLVEGGPAALKAAGEWPPKPGTMYFAPWMLRSDWGGDELTTHYSIRNARFRAPIILWLPDTTAWCIDAVATGKTTGWEVDGVPPKMTAKPSIHTVTYHGYLVDGVLSDDLESRTYDEFGRPTKH